MQAHQFVQVMKAYHPKADVPVSSDQIMWIKNKNTGVATGDAHILATAMIGGADILATENIKDFVKAKSWMRYQGVELMHHGQVLGRIFSKYPAETSDIHRFLLETNYPSQGQDHMFDVLRKSTKSGNLALDALQASLESSDPYFGTPSAIGPHMSEAFGWAQQEIQETRERAEQRLGTSSLMWVGAYTKKDGIQVSGHWREIR